MDDKPHSCIKIIWEYDVNCVFKKDFVKILYDLYILNYFNILMLKIIFKK
jgi:hypothetical protein